MSLSQRAEEYHKRAAELIRLEEQTKSDPINEKEMAAFVQDAEVNFFVSSVCSLKSKNGHFTPKNYRRD
jgi:hypothetical protein